MYAEHSTVELGAVTIHGGAFTRTPREADVGSQSADTIKFGFSSCSNLWKQSLRTRKASKPAAVGGLFFISQQQYVAYWHDADIVRDRLYAAVGEQPTSRELTRKECPFPQTVRR